ncbi:DNA polymerase epsilon subunit 3 [Allomyces arbusculus]|nr:DNA polymerase epsilon subunit 3 [Allomyces arbusculus]
MPQTNNDEDPSSINDYGLPKSQIAKIFKESVPPGTSLQREAREALDQATVTFVNYLTFMATEITTKAGKKTISPNDVLTALEAMEMPDLVPTLREALDQFQQQKQAKRAASGPKTKDVPSSAPPTEPPVPSAEVDEPDAEIDLPAATAATTNSTASAVTTAVTSTPARGSATWLASVAASPANDDVNSDEEIDIMDVDDD